MSLLLSVFPKFSNRPSLEKILHFWDPRWKGYQLSEFRLIWTELKIWSLLLSSTQQNNSYKQQNNGSLEISIVWLY